MSFLFRTSVMLAALLGLEKILGFVRQVAIARQFGLSPELDTFNAANNLPDLLFALISGGALAIAFIPVLSQYLKTRGRPAAWDLFSRIANLVFLFTLGLSLLMALLAEPIVSSQIGIAPGFDPQQQALIAELMRLNLFSTVIFSMAGLVIAGLQANQHFFFPALAPAMYDIGMLVGVFVLAPARPYTFGPLTLPALGLGIHGLVYGGILGAFLFLAIQIPALIRYGFRWTPAVDLRHPGVRQVVSLLAPRVFTVFFIQLIFIAQDNLASRVGAGAVTALVYGWLFMQVPETLIGSALGTALLPTLSEQIARDDEQGFRQTLNKTVRILLALTLPLTILLSLVIRPAVGILGLDPAATDLVVWTSRAFMLGLAGHSLLEVAVRAFYARQDARTPLLAAGLTALAFILLGALLYRPLGAPGIGLANALAFTAEALGLLWLLNRKYAGVMDIAPALLRFTAAGVLGGLVTFGVLTLGSNLPPGLLPQLLLASAALAAGILVILPWIWKQELAALFRL